MAHIAPGTTGRKPPEAGLKPLFVTISTALAITGLGRTKLYQLVGQGRVKTVHIGRRHLVIYESLESLGDDTEAARDAKRSSVA